MWKYQDTDELYHYGVLGMKWGHRKSLFKDIKNAKLARKSRDRNIQNEYFKKIENIEKGYKRGQSLSKKDLQREDAADDKAMKDWAASKAQYKKDKQKAKTAYKSKMKNLKNSREYKVHKQKMKNYGKAYLKTSLQNTALGAATIASSAALIKSGHKAAGLAVYGVGLAGTGTNIVRNFRKVRKVNENIK